MLVVKAGQYIGQVELNRLINEIVKKITVFY